MKPKKETSTTEVSQDDLKRIKENIEASYNDFKPNRERFYEWMNLTFNTFLTDADKKLLEALGKPQIEANINEAFISRLSGEYAESEPSLHVSAADGEKIDPKLPEFLDGHFRWLIYEANKDGFQYDIYNEQLGGGFSAMKALTEYESERSMEQVIRFKKPDDVTFVGFDPLARKAHKGDGNYWFELYPKTQEDFKAEFPNIKLDDLSFTKEVAEFNWSYTTTKNKKILLMCDYYEKKKKKVKLIKVSTGAVMEEDDYDDFIEEWNESIKKGLTLKQPPTIVKTRRTEITVVIRYILIESQILEIEETDYNRLNGVFVDGNSKWLKKNEYGGSRQMTRPYGYQTKGVQRLKNFAMQTLGNELENISQQPWMIAQEAIPDQEEYKEVWANPQNPSLLVHKAYWNKDTNKPLPVPQRVQRQAIPQEITNTFVMCDQAMQTVLGTYDAAQGASDNAMSGKAIIAGASQSNATAKPYIMSNLQALTQLGQIYLDLVPKYYKTSRSLPVMDKQGKRAFVIVNDDEQESVNLNYDSSKLHIRVESGVNFEVQKQQSLKQIIGLSQAEPVFANFINTMCLDILVDNLDIRGGDSMKERAEVYMKKLQASQDKGPPPNPMVQIKQQELQLKAQQAQANAQLEGQRLQIDQQDIANDRMKIILDAQQGQTDSAVQIAKSQTERIKAASDIAVSSHDQMLKHANQEHQHVKDALELTHQLSQPGYQSNESTE